MNYYEALAQFRKRLEQVEHLTVLHLPWGRENTRVEVYYSPPDDRRTIQTTMAGRDGVAILSDDDKAYIRDAVMGAIGDLPLWCSKQYLYGGNRPTYYIKPVKEPADDED